MDFFLNVQRWRVDHQFALVLLFLLQHRLVFGGGDVLVYDTIVFDGINRFGS